MRMMLARHRGGQQELEADFVAFFPSTAKTKASCSSEMPILKTGRLEQRGRAARIGAANHSLTFCFLSISNMRWRLAAREGCLDFFAFASEFAIFATHQKDALGVCADRNDGRWASCGMDEDAKW